MGVLMPVYSVDQSTKLELKRYIKKMVGVGILLAILTGTALFVVDLKASAPSFEAFRHVTLAMPRSQVDTVLAEYGIVCRRSSAIDCEFSDLLHSYTIVFSNATGYVIEKDFEFKQRLGVLRRLFSIFNPSHHV
jgi:hypothetical protein